MQLRSPHPLVRNPSRKLFIGLISAAQIIWGCVPDSTFVSTQETAADGTKGYTALTLPTGDRITLPYEVSGGQAIFEDDMILPIRPTTDGASGTAENALNAISTSIASRWPDGIIPYTLSSDLHPDLISRISTAINYWNKHTNIRLVRRTGQTNYVTFRTAPGGESVCRAHIGMIGGQQLVELSLDRCNVARVLHEIGHTVGLWHEHSRSDRDTYVDILWNNIRPEKKGAFFKISDYTCSYKSGGTGPCREIRIGSYDTASRMHYYSYNFTVNGEPTIRRKDGRLIYMYDNLSPGDIAGVNAMYPVETAPAPSSPLPPVAPKSCGVISANEGLIQGGAWWISSCNGRFTIYLQGDSNLALYQNWPNFAPLWWAQGAAGSGANALYMQPDGNVVLYRPNMSYVWNTGTYGNPGSRLAIQDDGNLVVYNSSGRAIWATNTAQPWAPPPSSPPPDVSPPTISTNLVAGGSYSGISSVSVSASDDRSGISYIQILVDGTYINGAVQGNYEFPWNTHAFSDGQHTVTLIAVDGAGNTGRMDVVVKIDNKPPVVYFQYPGASVYEGMGYSPPVKATDMTGIARVEFYLNDVYRERLTYYPNSNPGPNGGDWYPSTLWLTPGTYKLSVIAYDVFGHQASASTQLYVAQFDMCAYGCSPDCPDLCG